MKKIKFIKQVSKLSGTLVAIFGLGVAAISAVFGFGGRVFAVDETKSNTVDFSATIAPSLQVVIPAETITLNLVPELGKSVFTSQDFRILVATNNPTGYQMTLEADSTDLTRTEADNFGVFPKLQTLDAGTYTEDSFTVNRWGYKQDAGDYVPFATNIALSGTSGPTNGVETTLTFGARVDMNQQAGTYKLALNFLTVSNVVPGVETIVFDGNGADNPTAMGVQQIEAGKTATLNANKFTREEYNFLGWGTSATSGVVYADGADYSVELSSNNTSVTLFAQWEEAAHYLQTYTASQCATEAASAPVTLTDKRDNKEYRVRYINGVCTMIDNLALDPGSTGLNLTPTDTNIKQNRTLNAVSTTHFYTTDGYTTQGTYCQNNSNTGNYECYYNYVATTLGTITGNSNTTEATEDICPAGWRLPTGNNNQEQFKINNNYTWQLYNPAYKPATTTTTPGPEPFSPVAAGYDNNGSLHYSGTYGSWWSSTADSTTRRYYLRYLTSNGLRSGNYYDRYFGLSVRCVAGS